MVRLTGAALGFLAFAVTIFLGLSVGNTYETILERAMQAMFAFFALGMVVGWVGNRVVDEHMVKQNKEYFPDGYVPPEPPSPEEESTGDDAAAEAA